MNHLILKKYFFILIAFSFIVESCKRDIENASWDVNVVTPLLKSSLTISNILPDSLLETNADSSLSLVFSNTFYQASLDSLFQYPDTEMVYVAKLDSLVLGNQSFDTTLTIVDIAYMSDPFLGIAISAANGTYAEIPPIEPISSGAIPQDVSEYFETMTLVSGYIDFIIVNDLPIDITNVVFQLINQSDSSLVLKDSFDIVFAYSSDMVTVDLSGKTIEGNLIAELLNMESPGSNGDSVLIDTSDAVSIQMQMRDLHPLSATAVFPTQTVISKVDYLDIKHVTQHLTYIKVKSGKIKIEAVNTLPQELKFNYTLPGATLNGDTFSVQNTVPAAPVGGNATFSKEYDFSGYDLDLTMGKNGDTVNTMKQELYGIIDSSGQIATITLSDSFYVYNGMLDIIPEYIYGFLGNDTFNFGPSTITTDLFKSVTNGTLDFEDVNLSISVDNGIGANASVTFNEIKSINSKTGNTITLQGSAISQPFAINEALDNPLTPTKSELSLNDATTSGTASQFIENLPDQIGYSVQIIMNPGEAAPDPIGTGTDFIYYESGLKADMNLEIPLSLLANDLTLVDSLDFNLEETEQSKRIKDGTLNLIVENGFPFEADVQLYMYDESGSLLDSLFSLTKVSAASLSSNLMVSSSKKSKLTIPVNQEKVNKLYETKKMIILVSFSTASTSQYLKIYNHYSFDVQLTGDFNYTFE